ncbi:hypothetical protein AB6A40_004061 [Gnathostoma spinigerum]|uniref:Uncharacterized protein n=1 Tax=Gnathostoma spinigerum TaxID=75299 RepID=A0ABD6EDK5_9BILA
MRCSLAQFISEIYRKVVHSAPTDSFPGHLAVARLVLNHFSHCFICAYVVDHKKDDKRMENYFLSWNRLSEIDGHYKRLMLSDFISPLPAATVNSNRGTSPQIFKLQNIRE